MNSLLRHFLFLITIFFQNLNGTINYIRNNEDFSKILEQKLKERSELDFELFDQDQRLNYGPAGQRAINRITGLQSKVENRSAINLLKKLSVKT